MSSVRAAAFAIRVVLVASTSAGESLSLVIADLTLFGVGYFSLLLSAYILVMNRWGSSTVPLDYQIWSSLRRILLSDLPPPTNPLSRLSRNRIIFHVAIMVALGLGTAAFSITNNSSISGPLHIASTSIFLALTVVLALHSVNLARSGVFGMRIHWFWVFCLNVLNRWPLSRTKSILCTGQRFPRAAIWKLYPPDSLPAFAHSRSVRIFAARPR